MYYNIKIDDTKDVSENLLIQLIKDIYLILYKIYKEEVIKQYKYLNEELEYAVTKIEDSPGNLFIIFIKLFDFLNFLDYKHTDLINKQWLTYKKLVAEALNFSNQKIWMLRQEQFNRLWLKLKQENFFNF